MTTTNGVSGLVKVDKGKVEIAHSIYSRLGAKAENELYEFVHKDLDLSGITHVGMWWWKTEITDEIYLGQLSSACRFTGIYTSGKSVIFNKYKGDMKFASIYYYVSRGRLLEKGSQVFKDVKHLIDAADYDHVYLSPKAAKWMTDMLAIEDIIDA